MHSPISMWKRTCTYMALRKDCAEVGLKTNSERIGRCTGSRDIIEIILKTTLNTIQYGQSPILRYNNRHICYQLFKNLCLTISVVTRSTFMLAW